MSQSKLSLFPLVLTKEPVAMSRLIPEEERNKAYLDHHQLINSMDSKYFLKEYLNIEGKPGLPVNVRPINLFEKNYILGIKLKNNGDLPSTNVHVKILFKMYGSKNVYPKENISTTTFIDREFFDEKEINIHIPYIGANEEIPYKIFEQAGQFRETELILLSIKANGFTYVKKSVLRNFFYPSSKITLDHYKHSFIRLMEQDLLKQQKLIGSKEMKKFYGFLDKEE